MYRISTPKAHSWRFLDTFLPVPLIPNPLLHPESTGCFSPGWTRTPPQRYPACVFMHRITGGAPAREHRGEGGPSAASWAGTVACPYNKEIPPVSDGRFFRRTDLQGELTCRFSAFKRRRPCRKFRLFGPGGLFIENPRPRLRGAIEQHAQEVWERGRENLFQKVVPDTP